MGQCQCNICTYSKDEKTELQQTLITDLEKVNEKSMKNNLAKKSNIKTVTTENKDPQEHKYTFVSEFVNEKILNKPKEIYILHESLAKRENIENYYQIFPILLGSGGSSNIYLAKNQNEKFAVKKIVKGGIAKPEELIREADISLRLKHKNIMAYYDIFEDNNFIYFVMELGDEGDLFDFITSNEDFCLPSGLAIELLIQIFEAVDYLHSVQRIIHRDLKAENFMIKIDENNNPILKLIDFGLAENIPDGGEKLTEVVGTKKYCAPEMICEYGYNEKVDEWAIGVIMFSMLTGYEPFRRTGEYQVEYNIVFAEINFEIIEDPDLRFLNMKLLDRNPETRINCREALEYLNEVKKSREMIYNDNYYQEQRYLFIENYKAIINRKDNILKSKTV